MRIQLALGCQEYEDVFYMIIGDLLDSVSLTEISHFGLLFGDDIDGRLIVNEESVRLHAEEKLWKLGQLLLDCFEFGLLFGVVKGNEKSIWLLYHE